MEWKKLKKLGTMAMGVLLMSAALCGCDGFMGEQAAVWKEKLPAPLVQLAQTDWEALQTWLTGQPEEAPAEAGPDTEMAESAAVEETEVQLYFMDVSGTKLLEENRKIPKVSGIARATLEELLAGPRQENAAPLFPEGTRLNGITVTPEGVCRIDFSPEVRQIAAEEEEMVTLAVMKTLAQFPAVQSVQFMIDGLSVNSLTGSRAFDVQ